MATTAGSAGGGSGGAGFLFGNIDRRGRLDEDTNYLSDDARDNIDNVGESFTERDQELAQVRRDLRGSKAPGDATAVSDDEDDYDDPADNRVDYSNEKEEMEIEEAERARMALIALAPSKRVGDDDDDYDDDENEDDVPPKKDDETKPKLPGLPGIVLKAPLAPAPQPTTSTPSPSVAKASLKPEKDPVDEAAALQRRLLQEAKKNLVSNVVQPKKGRLIEDDRDNPVKFSEVFHMPVRKLGSEDFIYSKQRVYGVKVENDVPNTQTVEDDIDELLTPAPVPKSNPDAHFIEWDKRNIEAAKEAARQDKPVGDATMRERSESDDEGDDDAGLPMDPDAEPLEPVPECAHDPIMQVAWEDDIMFVDEWSAGEDDEGDQPLDPPPDLPKPEASKVAESKPAEPKKTETETTQATLDDDDSDEDMEWEDGITTNPVSVTPTPAAPSASTSKASIPSSKAPTTRPLKVPSSIANPLASRNGSSPGRPISALRSVPPAVVSKPSTMKSMPLIPLSKPPASVPNKTAGKNPNTRKSTPPIPLSKPTGPIGNKPSAKKPPTGKNAKAGDSKKGKGGKGKGKKANSETGKGKKGKNGDNAKKSVNFEDPPEKEEPPAPVTPKIPEKMPSEFVQQVLCPNQALADGSWVDDIIWDSGGSGDEAERIRAERQERFSQLILDPNDPNLIFESPRVASPKSVTIKADRGLRPMPRLALTDPFNISNDYYYSSGTTTNTLKVDRRSLLRGLNNAPPALKCQTAKGSHTDEALLYWHKPKIPRDFITSAPIELQPHRRRRPKGGSAQIAGQIPKKRSELFCSSKDAYRVALFEYSIEKQPCVLGIPGTASRILTYDRKTSAGEAAQALKNAAGTPEADTVFMAPEEPPPLHAGDIPSDSPPLHTVESHLFSAPCAQVEVPDTDFLVMRKGGKSFVREIDTIVSLGVTEPKVEVMAPNTDRFKKFGKERVSLFIIREFMKQQKKDTGEPPAIDKDLIFREFQRRRTYPETAIVKQLKELAKYQNGRYILSAEPSKGFANRENEILRTVSAEETAAFEAMEAGWETLSNLGVNIFTHPTSQGNLTQASERVLTMKKAAPVVASYIKHHLLHSPWYKSQVVIQAQKTQKKDMVQALSLARIVKDLREGGSVMESRMLSLSAGDLQRVLINHFRILARKVPDDVEERRSLVREYAMKRNKSSEVQDYPKIIEDILEKHRNAGSRTGPTANNAASHAAMHVIPLEIQRDALEKGDVSKLKTEIERTEAVGIYESCTKPIPELARLKSKRSLVAVVEPNGNRAGTNIGKPPLKKPKTMKKKPSPKQNPKRPAKTDELGDLEQLTKLTKSWASADGSSKNPLSVKVKSSKPPLQSKPSKSSKNGQPPIGPVVPISSIARGLGNSSAKPRPSSAPAGTSAVPPSAPVKHVQSDKRLPTSLKITKMVPNEHGVKERRTFRVTDPAEIKKIMAAKERKEAAKAGKSKDGIGSGGPHGPGSSSGVKVAIKLDALNAKPVAKKKPSSEPDKPKPPPASKKRPRESDDPGTSGSVRKVGGDKGYGKIRINTKHLKKEREEAAQKRLKAQYGDDDYRAKKSSKSGMTSRKKRNGQVQLNGMLESIEKTVRSTRGYIRTGVVPLTIARYRDGDPLPNGAVLKNLATPAGTALDLTQPVNMKAVPRYGELIKKPIDLGTIRHKCKKMEYSKSSEFVDDFKLMLNNARLFNKTPDVQWVVQHCEHLLDVAKEEVEKKKEDIRAAEDAIVRVKRKSKSEGKEGTASAATSFS